MTETLIQEIVTKAVRHVPASVREVEAAIFRQSLHKAAAMLGEPTPWAERCLRRMGEQFTVFKGQAGPSLPEKRKR
jgi:hypothetical protein